MKHTAIIIPGLSNEISGFKFITKHWLKKYSLEPFIFSVSWTDNKNYEIKLKKLVNKIDEFSNKKYKITLLGASAGGSCAINAYCQRKNKINKVVNVCGRLRKGKNLFPSLDFAARNSFSFKQSVLLCEKNLQSLTIKDKSKILTIHSFYDEIVPNSLIPIIDATNIRILSVEHVLNIFLAMTLYSKIIIDFILR